MTTYWEIQLRRTYSLLEAACLLAVAYNALVAWASRRQIHECDTKDSPVDPHCYVVHTCRSQIVMHFCNVALTIHDCSAHSAALHVVPWRSH